MLRPVTVAVVVLPLAVVTLTPPGDEVTVYEVMGAPPLETGAVQLTVACAFAAVALIAVGAPGTVAGVTELDGVDAALGPTALVAVTVNVYAVPLLSPVTTALVALAPTFAVNPPGDDVTV